MVELVLMGVLNGILEGFGRHLLQRHILPQWEGHGAVIGAPDWYDRDQDNAICASAAASGELDGLERAKGRAEQSLQERIRRSIALAVADYQQQLQSPATQRIAVRFEDETALQQLIWRDGVWQNRLYQPRQRQTLVRLCIDTDRLQQVQRTRLLAIAEEELTQSERRALDELDRAVDDLPGSRSTNADPFSELQRQMERNF